MEQDVGANSGRALRRPSLRATEFEFRYRFFIIIAIFIGGFECYALDPVNVSAMLAKWLMGHHVAPGVSKESLGHPFGGGCMSLKLAGSLNGESTTYGQTLASF
jgi:hypothetical protein